MEASTSESVESEESETSSPDEDGDILPHLLAVSDAGALATKLKSEKWRRLINAVNEHRRTPLHLAIMAQMIDAVEALLDAGASAVIPDREGNTALHLCCKKGFDAGFFAILSTRTQQRDSTHQNQSSPFKIKQATEVNNVQSTSQNTEIKHATEVNNVQSTSQKTEIKPKTQIKATLEFEPNLLDFEQDAAGIRSTLSNIDTGMTPTDFIGGASSHPSLDDRIFPNLDDGCEYFLRLDDYTLPSADAESESSKQKYMGGGTIDTALGKENYEGDSCAILATKSGNKRIIAQLHRLSVNLNAGDMTSGRTPLHHAVDMNDLDLIKFLIEDCAVEINSKSFSGETPLAHAKERGLDAAVDLLQAYGAT